MGECFFIGRNGAVYGGLFWRWGTRNGRIRPTGYTDGGMRYTAISRLCHRIMLAVGVLLLCCLGYSSARICYGYLPVVIGSRQTCPYCRSTPPKTTPGHPDI